MLQLTMRTNAKRVFCMLLLSLSLFNFYLFSFSSVAVPRSRGIYFTSTGNGGEDGTHIQNETPINCRKKTFVRLGFNRKWWFLCVCEWVEQQEENDQVFRIGRSKKERKKNNFVDGPTNSGNGNGKRLKPNYSQFDPALQLSKWMPCDRMKHEFGAV